MNLRWPSVQKMGGRKSTIVGGICNAIMPSIQPTEQEVNEVLACLGQKTEDLRCCYCGDKASEWDHFYSVTMGKKPSGYVTEINNLIPSCGKCNQSRGNKDPIEWMKSPARHSPKSRLIESEIIERNIKIIRNFIAKHPRVKIDAADYETTEEWKKLMDVQSQIINLLDDADTLIVKLRQKLERVYQKKKSNLNRSVGRVKQSETRQIFNDD